MNILRFTSCMAQNMDFIGRFLADYIHRQLNIPTEFVEHIPWQEREQGLDKGDIHIGWICGAPYIQKADKPEPVIELLVAPVMVAARYQNRPIYFSDVVVHRDSPFHIFADLHGASWAYNEPRSHSGYVVTCYTLAQRGKTAEFFRQTIQSGAHQHSLQMILNRQVDASAIDSTVLELELRRDPTIANHIRTIDTFGPSSIPPWVIRQEVPVSLRESLRQLLCQMHEDEEAREVLERGGIGRFVSVQDGNYNDIRHMARLAEAVDLSNKQPL